MPTICLPIAVMARPTTALAQWVQGLYPDKEDRPVLVGGAAVELLTGGAYVTGDLDFVGSVTSGVAGALIRSGFTREGRHWFHEEGRVFLEFPSSALGTEEEAHERVFSHCAVLIVSAEDLIVDRLAAWVHWRSAIDGINAFLVYRAAEADLDLERLKRRSNRENVQAALKAVKELYANYQGTVPDVNVMEAWAERGPG